MEEQAVSMQAGRLPLCEQVPGLGTPRLLLRPVRESDQDALIAFWTSERSSPNDGPHAEDAARNIPYIEAVSWYFRGYGLWIAVNRRTGKRLVAVSLTPTEEGNIATLGWDVLDPAAEGWGFATEAAQALLDHGRALGYAGLRARMYADNVRSRRLAERLGGVHQGSYMRNGREAVTYGFTAGVSA
ncbi:GNAT family N-acetyltransferase [Paracoccus sp. (in: a-proteobacteria)]|uniref:GNAT family N-acetyltransferase n=1 Tax=Paracoccus sp. TaxID=267 RepID=UPI003A8486F0